MENHSLKAIYRPIQTDEQVQQQDTLVYSLRDGFAWVRLREGNADWHTKALTAVQAEREARMAGLDPLAIFYVPN